MKLLLVYKPFDNYFLELWDCKLYLYHMDTTHHLTMWSSILSLICSPCPGPAPVPSARLASRQHRLDPRGSGGYRARDQGVDEQHSQAPLEDLHL